MTAGARVRSLSLSVVACYRCRPVGLGLNPDSTPLHGLMTSRYRGGGAVPRHHGGRESHPTSVNKLSRSHLLAGPSDLPTAGSSEPNGVAPSKTTRKGRNLRPISLRATSQNGSFWGQSLICRQTSSVAELQTSLETVETAFGVRYAPAQPGWSRGRTSCTDCGMVLSRAFNDAIH